MLPSKLFNHYFFLSHFYILPPPTQGDKRGARTKKTEAAIELPFLCFYSSPHGETVSMIKQEPMKKHVPVPMFYDVVTMILWHTLYNQHIARHDAKILHGVAKGPCAIRLVITHHLFRHQHHNAGHIASLQRIAARHAHVVERHWRVTPTLPNRPRSAS